jgi:hypothetical protein
MQPFFVPDGGYFAPSVKNTPGAVPLPTHSRHVVDGGVTWLPQAIGVRALLPLQYNFVSPD